MHNVSRVRRLFFFPVFLSLLLADLVHASRTDDERATLIPTTGQATASPQISSSGQTSGDTTTQTPDQQQKEETFPFHDPHFGPNRTVMVQLHAWRFDDIGRECQEFLGPRGFAGVQISPPVSEHRVGEGNPISEQYAIVSYSLKKSRAGTLKELRHAIARCNRSGVRVYVDIVINHMGSTHLKVHHGHGSAGSFWNTSDFSYPGVPFNRSHFHTRKECGTKSGEVKNQTNVHQVRYCELDGLQDLDQSIPHVRDMQVKYLDHLIRLGVAGFRVDTGMYMIPSDLQVIMDRVRPLDHRVFGQRGLRHLSYFEVRASEPKFPVHEFYPVGRIIGFHFADSLATMLHHQKNRRLSHLRRMRNHLPPGKHVQTITDNHDLQRNNPPHGEPSLSFKEPKFYVLGVAIMLSYPYGIPRIMSSYYFTPEERIKGPPHYEHGVTAHVQTRGDHCLGGWVCEHRWIPVRNMVQFSNVVAGSPDSNWWDDGKDGVAFARTGKGFIVVNNNRDSDLRQKLDTSLPPGRYCDVISGNREGNKCSGKTILVTPDGKADFDIPFKEKYPVMAIHVGQRLPDDEITDSPPVND